MKKLIIVFVIMFAGLFTTESKAWNTDVDFNFFYHNLNPYGEWIEVDYDLVVWKPYGIDRTWSPYSVGQWEYTDYGWYWDSYEPFGWATYHYGRWYYDDYYGWVWVPGYEWGPSWVEWRYSDSYIGWSPLPPYADFRISVGIHFSVNYRTSYYYWNFVPYNRFCHRNVNVYFVHSVNKNYIFNNTKYRTNYYADRGRIINGGIDRNYVERRAGTRIQQREVSRTTDLRDYTGSRGSAERNRIVSYRPSEREVEKYRGTDVRIEKRGSSKSSLKRNIVTFRDEEKVSRENNTSSRETIDFQRNNDALKRSPETTNRRNIEGTRDRVYRGSDNSKNSSRYEIKSYGNNRENKSYRSTETKRNVTKSVRESIKRSANKSSSYNRTQSSNSNRSSISNNRSSVSKQRSYRSNSRSSTPSKSSSRSSSRSSSKGKRK